jgi:beta-galactosidase
MKSRFLGLGIILSALSLSVGRAPAAEPRQVISLDGVWEIAEGVMGQPPERSDRRVPVPGLADMATPAFADPPGPKVSERGKVPQKDSKRDAFWYRRSFRLDAPAPEVARIKVRKAMFGTRVILNGRVLGDHLPSFTPGYFDAKAALKSGDNELLIRVGADRDAVGPAIPSGFDFEKERYIPGIFDSVELILSGTPHFLHVQTAPDIAARTVRVQAVLRNEGPPKEAVVQFVVREAKSGREVGRHTAAPVGLAKGEEATVDVRLPITDCRLWSPEDPFLYALEADSGADRFRTRFGMREFKLDPATGRAVLNGKTYFMRGSNFTLYRFFEDPARGDLPWRPDWVRLLHQRVKEMHWNCLRYCIGFPPEAWYDIADETGILIQDEFPIWSHTKETKREELATEYAEWMRERWNHPCVVIWDANNETHSNETGPAIQQVRGLDLSNRPWDNSYNPPQEPGDVFESHPYHFNPAFRLRNLASADSVPQGNAIRNDGRHAVIINEYGWHWLNRDGTPTTLTRDIYRAVLGENATPAQRFRMQAAWLAADTEFWRAHRKAAAVVHFTMLGYSRPDGQTCDHWADVAKLTWEPEFLARVRDAFAPVGIMIDAWADEYPAGARREFPVIVINDLEQPWQGSVRFRLLHHGTTLEEHTQACEVAGFGSAKVVFTIDIPRSSGGYQLEAALVKPGADPVRSLRDFEVLTDAERRARFGIAVGKPVAASSNLARDGASTPTAAADGRSDTRWSSEFSDPQWISIDLGKPERINRVVLVWEAAHGKAYSMEVSTDGQAWTEVYRTVNGKGGREEIRFAPVDARWVRMAGTQRATQFGYSLYEFEIFPAP